MIITIDGPVASGKSTLARLIAEKRGFFYINSGYLYRSLAYVLVTEFSYDEAKLQDPNFDDIRFVLHESNFVYHYENGILDSSIEQLININNDGNYTLDLILFPSLDDEDKLFDESDITYQEDLSLDNKIPIILILITIFTIGFIFYWKFGKKNSKKDLELELQNKFEDTQLINVLKYIKQNNDRVNQKEIRKDLKLSEAKLSLILSQLESEGKIRKIKRGRGNIIIIK